MSLMRLLNIIKPRRVISRKRGLDITQRQLLEIMRSDNARSESPFRPTRHWAEVNGRFARLFRRYSIDATLPEEINTNFATHPVTSAKYYGYAAWMTYNRIRAVDSLKVLGRIGLERNTADPDTVVFNERHYNWTY